MNPRRTLYGLTLVELLMAITIVGILALGITGLLSTCLQAERFGNAKSNLMLEGNLVMEQIVKKIQMSYNASVSSNTLTLITFDPYTDNVDAHYYLNDRLFPRPNPNSSTTWSYSLNSALGILQETAVTSATSINNNLLQNVTAFTPTFTPIDATQDSSVQIDLTLDNGAGITLSWSETIFPANTTQKYRRRLK